MTHSRKDFFRQELHRFYRPRHFQAGPMHAHHNVVDAKAFVELDNLLGNVVRRSDEKAVFKQFLKGLPEFVLLARRNAKKKALIKEIPRSVDRHRIVLTGEYPFISLSASPDGDVMTNASFSVSSSRGSGPEMSSI